METSVILEINCVLTKKKGGKFMWQLYIIGEDGNEKPYLKPWKDLESAEKFAEMIGIMPYTVRKVKS
jgi:hypothetical protein